MKVEMLCTGNIENILREKDIDFKVTYSGEKYKVLEVEKADAKMLNNTFLENAWCEFSNGAGGSLCDVIDINGSVLIGWESKKSNYNTLTDYIIKGLKAVDDSDVCYYASGLAKANGKSLSRLFKDYEG